MVFLQQDAFDAVDASTFLERQRKSFGLLKRLIEADYRFVEKDAARDYFTRITGAYKNLIYSPEKSPEFECYQQEIEQLFSEHAVASHAEIFSQSFPLADAAPAILDYDFMKACIQTLRFLDPQGSPYTCLFISWSSRCQ